MRDYQPSMLDELISSSDVVWVGSKASGSNAKEAGEIAFYPAGSLLLNQPESAVDKLNDNETLTMPDAVLTALSGGGAFPIQLLSAVTKTIWLEHAEAQVNPETGEIIFPAWGERQFEEALWSLVWQGKMTNSSFAPVRALLHGGKTVRAPRRAARRRVTMRPPTPLALSGLWSAVSCGDGRTVMPNKPLDGVIEPGMLENSDTGIDMAHTASVEERELALIDSLLDRYGVIAAPLVDKERIAGRFFSALSGTQTNGRTWHTGPRHVRERFWRGTIRGTRHRRRAAQRHAMAQSILRCARRDRSRQSHWFRNRLARTGLPQTGTQIRFHHCAQTRRTGTVLRAKKP